MGFLGKFIGFVASCIAIAILVICSYAIPGNGNLEWVKDRAVDKWNKQGFTVVDYEGYAYGGGWKFTRFGGARVWYRLVRKDNNSLVYSGYMKRWGDEVHVYGPILVEGSTKIDIGN